MTEYILHNGMLYQKVNTDILTKEQLLDIMKRLDSPTNRHPTNIYPTKINQPTDTYIYPNVKRDGDITPPFSTGGEDPNRFYASDVHTIYK